MSNLTSNFIKNITSKNLISGYKFYKNKIYRKSLGAYLVELGTQPDSINAIEGAANSYLKLRGFEKSLEHYQLLKDSDKFKIGNLSLNLAVNYSLLNDYEEAILLNEKLEKISYGKKNLLSEIYNNLAINHFLKKNFEISKEYFIKSIDSSKSYFNLLNFGIYYLYFGDIDNSLKFISKAREVIPDEWQTNYFLGIICFKLEKFNESIKYFDKVYIDKPDFFPVYLYLSKIYKKLNNFEKAISYLKKLSFIEDRLFYNFFEMANIYQLQNDDLESISFYEKSIECSIITKQELFFSLLIRHMDLKDNIEIHFSEDLDNISEIDKAYFNLATLYQKSDNLPLAILNYEKYLILNDDENISKTVSDLKKQKELKEAIAECGELADKVFKDIELNHEKVKNKITNPLITRLKEKKEFLLYRDMKEDYGLSDSLNEVVNNIEMEVENDSKKLVNILKVKKKYLKDFTVSLFGRTRAGKSTIRETLTFNSKSQAYKWIDSNGLEKEPVFFGSGETIGKGGQRTTIDVYEYSWKGLRLIDTPGIDAYGGEEDTKKAKEVIEQSDIILCLATDDAIQQAELDEIKDIIDLDKKVLFLVNVKYNLQKPEELQRALRKPEKVFVHNAIQGHKQRITKHIEIDHNDIHFIHAQSAFLSTDENYHNYSAKLFDFSRMDNVYSKILEDVKKNGKKRRVETLYNDYICFLNDTRSKLEANIKFISKKINLLIKTKIKLGLLFDNYQKDADTALEESIKSACNQLTELLPAFIDENIAKRKVNELFQIQLKTIMSEKIDSTIKDLRNNLQIILTEFNTSSKYEENTIFSITTSSIKVKRLKNSGIGDLLKFSSIFSGLSLAALEGAAALGFANIWNPGGWIILSVSVGAGLTGWIGNKLINKKSQKIIEAKKKLKNEIIENLNIEQEKIKKIVKSKFKEEFIEKIKDELNEPMTFCIKELESIDSNLSSTLLELTKLIEELKTKKLESIKKYEDLK